MLEIVESKASHAKELLKDINKLDLQEIERLGTTPLKVLFQSYRQAVYRKTAFIDGQIAAMWGVCGTVLGNTGFPYLLTTNRARDIPTKTFINVYKSELEFIASLFNKLEVSVDADHYPALRVLKTVGFNISKPIYINGYMFRQCVYE